MAYDRFLIAPFNSGMRRNEKPWLIPEDAFEALRNMYVFRGTVRKRFGTRYTGSNTLSPETAQLNSRVRIQVDTTDGFGDAIGFVSGVIYEVGQMFSIGTDTFTVNVAGAGALLLHGSGATTATFSTTNGAYNFVGASLNTAVYFYPAQPIMGITQYESGAINNQTTFAFDTQFPYEFTGSSWERSTVGAPFFNGDDTNFFWASNWQANNLGTVMYVSNFHVTNKTGVAAATDDPIWYWNGTTWAPATGTGVPGAFFTTPAPGGVPGPRANSKFILTARLIIPYKNRVLLLNTIENNNADMTGIPSAANNNSHFPNRCRFSFIGSPLARNAWYEREQSDTDGTTASNYAGGGFIDAPTKEEIVGADFIKDRLIVYFERSTWELAYTGNNILPFVWQQINTELGAEATFSIVPFDKAILAIGNTGVHACSGANVQRIDDAIPDEIFKIIDKNEGVQRVAGVRDYFAEMVYWTFPSTTGNNVSAFPDTLLVYNYANGTWALFDDTYTAFGFFEQQSDITWASTSLTWQEFQATWTSGVEQSQFRQIAAGNQEGYIVLVDTTLSSLTANLQITDFTLNALNQPQLVVVNHTLEVGDYVRIASSPGIVITGSTILPVLTVVDANTLVLDPGASTFAGAYTGGGTVARVSNVSIVSKEYNPYISTGDNVYIMRVDFGVERTAAGELTIDYTSSSSTLLLKDPSAATQAQLDNKVLEMYPLDTFEGSQERLWHTVYFDAYGSSIQFNMYWTDSQIRDSSISLDDVVIQGMVLYTRKSGDII